MSYHPIHPKASYSQHERAKKSLSLPLYVEQAIHEYFIKSEGEPITDLYQTVLAAIEPPLFKVILKFCKTQNKAAEVLGLSRGTLRKKLKQYHFIEE